MFGKYKVFISSSEAKNAYFMSVEDEINAILI